MSFCLLILAECCTVWLIANIRKVFIAWVSSSLYLPTCVELQLLRDQKCHEDGEGRNLRPGRKKCYSTNPIRDAYGLGYSLAPSECFLYYLLWPLSGATHLKVGNLFSRLTLWLLLCWINIRNILIKELVTSNLSLSKPIIDLRNLFVFQDSA